MAGKQVGQLNGFYAFMFKINQVIIPVMLAGMLSWGVWVTKSIFRDEKDIAVDHVVLSQTINTLESHIKSHSHYVD